MHEEPRSTQLVDEVEDVGGARILEWREVDVPDALDGSRQFDAQDEFDLRSRRVARLGKLLVVGFALPIVGMPGDLVAFPQFEALGRWDLATVTALLPLVVGVVLWTGGRRFDAPLRSLLLLAGGLSLFGLVFGYGGIGAFLADAVQVTRSPALRSFWLLLFGIGGLYAAGRVRWYRPTRRSAYPVACVAAACYAAFLVLPVEGLRPIGEPVRAFGEGLLVGLGVTSHLVLMASAAFVSVRNTPGTPAWNAARAAGRAHALVVAAFVVPFLILVFAGVLMLVGAPSLRGAGSTMTLIASMAVKLMLTFGVLLLLIPVGVADLWVGRSGPGDRA